MPGLYNNVPMVQNKPGRETLTEVFRSGSMEVHIRKENSLRRLYLELTTACNMSCPMCFRRNYENCDSFMDGQTLAMVYRSIDELDNLDHVVLGGIGEPLMHGSVRELACFIRERNIQLSLQTNGLLLRGDTADFIVETGFDRIIISYEPGELGHGENREILSIINNLAGLRKNMGRDRPAIWIEIVLTVNVMEELTGLCRDLADSGADGFILTNLLPVDEGYTDKIIYSTGREPDTELLRPFYDMVRRNSQVRFPNFSLKTERHCYFIENDAAVIRFDGSVTPCYRLLHDGGREYINGRCQEVNSRSFGNINRGDLLSIWNSRDYLWFRHVVRNALYPSCTDCKFYSACDYVNDVSYDCWGNSPSCGNCLWSRRIIICP